MSINSALLHYISFLQRFLGLIGVFTSASSFLEVNFIKAFSLSSRASHTAQVISCLFNLKRIYEWQDNSEPSTTSCTQNKWTEAVVAGCFVLALLSLLCPLEVDVDKEWWAVLWRTRTIWHFSLVLPPSPASSSAISLSTFNNMIERLSPAGKSATRGAGTESWRTCMKTTHLQRLRINLTPAPRFKKKRACRKLFVLYLSLCFFLS